MYLATYLALESMNGAGLIRAKEMIETPLGQFAKGDTLTEIIAQKNPGNCLILP